MTRQQKIAMVVAPLLALVILFGGNTVLGGPDGELFEGIAKGFDGEIKVRVEVAEDEILSIDILEINDTPGLGDEAAREIIEKILENQSTDVDIVSGATGSSKGTIKAVENALGIVSDKEVDSVSSATAPNGETTETEEKEYTPTDIDLDNGEYEGTAKGFDSTIRVNVKLVDGKIHDIELVEIGDTQGLGDKAAKEVIEAMVSSSSLDVDTVTGATASSRGTINAVKNALGL